MYARLIPDLDHLPDRRLECTSHTLDRDILSFI